MRQVDFISSRAGAATATTSPGDALTADPDVDWMKVVGELRLEPFSPFPEQGPLTLPPVLPPQQNEIPLRELILLRPQQDLIDDRR
jgi:hypothetical protein